MLAQTTGLSSAPGSFRLLVLPGDGIGPEVIEQAVRVLKWFDGKFGTRTEMTFGLLGGSSIDRHGTPVTDELVQTAQVSDAVLLGAVGGKKWDDLPVSRRPEAGLIRLRRELGVFANLRPAICYPDLVEASSLHSSLVRDLDLLIIRELTSGVYFGQPRGTERMRDGRFRAFDTQAYSSDEVERVCRVAFTLARKRSRRLCSVDKANVMETGQFWRGIVTRISADYPEVELSHMYADNCAMQLVRRPKQFDVIVTDNLFGDILSDVSAMLTGSLGLLPSASLRDAASSGRSFGLYEPVHGSAPDIAGQGVANPLGTILSLGMCFRYSLGAPERAELLDVAIREALRRGFRTADIAGQGKAAISTVEITDRLLDILEAAS
jgi:3-isopropylmalate dehydrogenase